MDSDNYEDVEKKSSTELIPPPRPSAMELVSSKRKSLAFTKTLWCQIPEVLQSSVLSKFLCKFSRMSFKSFLCRYFEFTPEEVTRSQVRNGNF